MNVSAVGSEHEFGSPFQTRSSNRGMMKAVNIMADASDASNDTCTTNLPLAHSS